MQFVEQKRIKMNIKTLKNNIMNKLILGPVAPTFGSIVRKVAAGYGDHFPKIRDSIITGALGTVGAGIRDFIPVDGGIVPEIVVTPNGNYLLEQHNVQPVIIEENLPQELNIYDRIEIEDPRKSKTYYASIEKMAVGGQIDPETDFRDDLTMPIAAGDRAERIMDIIDRRANRAVRRNVRRWDRLRNQHARDFGRLNKIDSVRRYLHLPESRRDAEEAVLNYLNSIGMNEAENLPKYPWHY